MLAPESHPLVEQNRGLSDEEVAARVRGGDPGLFELIMRRYNQRLFRVTRSILRNDSDAEDAVQQAYLSAFTHLDQFAGDAKLSTWLTRIALNEALARQRRQARNAEVDLSEPTRELKSLSAKEPSPEEQTSRHEVTGLLEQSIDELPEIYRVVVMMREVQELSTAETAACLDLSEEAVKVRLHRAKALLRQAMCARLESGAPEAFAFLGARCDRIVAAVLQQLALL